ncbi:antiviral reverse transcriptase Drt3a [Methylobacterium sp. 391_Methyba4]|uniref:antiviral reverse transcriptase Drt3a n=1 Tax=Methylobacterium sp. 391_Methyba4 TaxID=3038924 RepID=UPI00242011C1|nr:antiviral reverse transcriptase Drt3a [Methylobacterium sp. 391_Methyba4]WFS09558.1 RNA-directed DNA polymerase [Methylobacterium sp. 391_Methyba4]
MYDPTFHSRAFRNELTHNDYLRDRRLFLENYRNALIADAARRVETGYEDVELKWRTINGAPVYALGQLADEVVLRKITRNIKQVTRVRQSNRSHIVKCIQSLCQEGLSFKLYKIDIKKFYDSITTEMFLSSIVSDSAFPPATTRLLSSFFEEMRKRGIGGLPRGLSLSSVLSEYVMRPFDRAAASIDGVFFFSRFVDDMVFITRGDEDHERFISGINKLLPCGLTASPQKTKCFPFKSHDKSNVGVEGEVDFLGYVFRIGFAKRDENGRISRDVQLDIADKKIRRMKSRICLSLLQFTKDRNFSDLEKRIRMLSSNYSVTDFGRRRIRNVGIYHNYRLVGPGPSKSLRDLDAFYKKMILSNQGKICSRLQLTITRQQRSALLRYSFERAFTDRTHFDFNPKAIGSLKKCWNNV